VQIPGDAAPRSVGIGVDRLRIEQLAIAAVLEPLSLASAHLHVQLHDVPAGDSQRAVEDRHVTVRGACAELQRRAARGAESEPAATAEIAQRRTGKAGGVIGL
jgi:hypothetical protein